MITIRDNNKKPDVRSYLGKTGGGKTTQLLADLHTLNCARLIVWDYKHDYVLPSFDRLAPLVEHVRKNKTFQVAYHVNQYDPVARQRDFDIVCQLAYHTAKQRGGCGFVVEELQYVTKSNWAPIPWNQCVVTGRNDEMKILATSQRPANMDKDFLGNCTHITCCGLGYDDDAVTVAKNLPGVTPADLMALAPGAAYCRGPDMQNAEFKTIFTP